MSVAWKGRARLYFACTWSKHCQGFRQALLVLEANFACAWDKLCQGMKQAQPLARMKTALTSIAVGVFKPGFDAGLKPWRALAPKTFCYSGSCQSPGLYIIASPIALPGSAVVNLARRCFRWLHQAGIPMKSTRQGSSVALKGKNLRKLYQARHRLQRPN